MKQNTSIPDRLHNSTGRKFPSLGGCEYLPCITRIEWKKKKVTENGVFLCAHREADFHPFLEICKTNGKGSKPDDAAGVCVVIVQKVMGENCDVTSPPWRETAICCDMANDFGVFFVSVTSIIHMKIVLPLLPGTVVGENVLFPFARPLRNCCPCCSTGIPLNSTSTSKAKNRLHLSKSKRS